MGAKVTYPGLREHKQHELLNRLRSEDYGCGGMLTVDFGSQQVEAGITFECALRWHEACTRCSLMGAAWQKSVCSHIDMPLVYLYHCSMGSA